MTNHPIDENIAKSLVVYINHCLQEHKDEDFNPPVITADALMRQELSDYLNEFDEEYYTEALGDKDVQYIVWVNPEMTGWLIGEREAFAVLSNHIIMRMDFCDYSMETNNITVSEI